MATKGFNVQPDKTGTHTITAVGASSVTVAGGLAVQIDDTLREADVRSAIRAFERYVRRNGSATTSPDDWPTSGSVTE
jgi:polysaccharide deacetylase 2 family uncharacterized protein YibQ